MAYLNNIYGNAAFVGFYAGMLDGRGKGPIVAASYATLVAAAIQMAIDVDALIVFDALVTTAAGITQLAITTNIIAANEQWRGNMLMQLCYASAVGRMTLNATEAGNQTGNASSIFAAWTQGIASLVTP